MSNRLTEINELHRIRLTLFVVMDPRASLMSAGFYRVVRAKSALPDRDRERSCTFVHRVSLVFLLGSHWPTASRNVRVRGQSGKHVLIVSSSDSDPTRTSDQSGRPVTATNPNVNGNARSRLARRVLRVTIPVKRREGSYALVCLDRGGACRGGDGRR